ncbi:MAG: hypothetical protein DLM68_14605 [Hyphomicrobiales bacterium]|nr:MAG: hypothetical protein DLM68_14605 [Hyphomicrobiales bacterium]
MFHVKRDLCAGGALLFVGAGLSARYDWEDRMGAPRPKSGGSAVQRRRKRGLCRPASLEDWRKRWRTVLARGPRQAVRSRAFYLCKHDAPSVRPLP